MMCVVRMYKRVHCFMPHNPLFLVINCVFYSGSCHGFVKASVAFKQLVKSTHPYQPEHPGLLRRPSICLYKTRVAEMRER